MAMLPTIYNSYWSLFLTSAAGLTAAGNAIVLSIIGVADIISILLVSFIVQKCNLRFGKFRFWVLIGGVGAAVTRVIAFTPLMFGSVAYFAVMIVISSSLYNLAYCAYMGMLPVIADTQEERMSAVTAQQQWVAVFAIVVSLISVTVIQNVGYAALSAIAAVAIIASVIPMYIATKDVDVYKPVEKMSEAEKEAQPSTWDMICLLFNVPMLTYLIGSVCKVIGSIGLTMLVSYYYTYAFGDMSMLTVYLTISTVLQLVGASLAPVVNRIVKGNRNTFAAGLLIDAALLAVAWLIGSSSALLFTIALSIAYMGWAVAHTADAAYYSYIGDYVEYKHHKNIQPFLMSMLSMVIKIGVALTSVVVGWGLVAIGFDAENVTEAAKTGIMNLTTVLPMIVLIVGAVVTFLNPLNDKKVEEIHTELAKRHAAEAGR
ncbi:MAG: MFS transporter [Lachnospiraceae bacterium]|nr:MFS transporter [Lachnospiraceae bacterium]